MVNKSNIIKHKPAERNNTIRVNLYRFCRTALSSAVFIPKRITQLLHLSIRGVRILNYHHVEKAGFWESASGVSFKAFAEQMKYLYQNGYTSIYPEDILKEAALPEKPIVITFDDGYEDNYQFALPVLKKFGLVAVVFLITDFVDGVYQSARMLTWSQVKEMKECGIRFGSHTKTHRVLTQLTEEDIRRELWESKILIEDKLCESTTYFCYPNGMFNSRIKELVKESGYLTTCSTLPGESTKKTDPYLLRRTWISPNDNLFDFKKKLDGAFDFFYRILESKKLGHLYFK